jgi:tetratricopeptide (TPR) repeat protein
MPFKIYAHTQNQCLILKFPSRPSSRELEQKFIHIYNKKNKSSTIDSTTSILAFDPTLADLQHKGDANVTITPSAPTPTATKKARPSPPNPLTAACRPLLKGASDAFKKKQYRKAKNIYEQILNLDPSSSIPNTAALYGLATVAAANNKHAEVLAAVYPNAQTPPDVADLKDFGAATKDPPFLELLGDTLFALNHLRSAIRCYDECVQVDLEINPSASVKIQDGRKLKMANVLYTGGEHGSAITVIQDVLSRGEDNPRGLRLYAQAAWDQGHFKAAIEVTMKGLVLDTDNKRIKQQLSTFVKGNAHLLLDIFSHVKSVKEGGDRGSAIGTAQALAFLATVIKDYGAIEECIQVYERVVVLAPDSASYCLNLMHAYELQLKYESCLERAALYGIENQWSSTANKGCIDPRVLTTIVAKSKRACFRPTTKDYLQHPERNKQEQQQEEQQEQQQNTEAEDSLDEEMKQWNIQWEDGENNGAVVVDKNGASVTQTSTPNNKVDLNKDGNDLDLLAVFFTVTKVLYITGRLDFIPSLINAIEEIRRGQQLHKTTVRNEHAYYCCIAQLLSIPYSPYNEGGQGSPGGNHSASTTAPLVVCGDSHSLTSAWRTCNNRCIQPLLVTGLKAWHLREESEFYPKINFYNAMKCLPEGADVVMLFCEIDCREGILLAVEKDRYVNVEEGIQTNVNIYVKTLLNIKTLKKINKLFVHPVPPVLDATRTMVLKFNRLLRQAVEKTGGSLLWLDFENDLIDTKGMNQIVLKEELVLDGTHMSPHYIPYMEKALQKW